MSNTATYLDSTEKAKLKKIAETAKSSESMVLKCIVHYMPEDYLVDMVKNYQEDLKRAV